MARISQVAVWSIVAACCMASPKPVQADSTTPGKGAAEKKEVGNGEDALRGLKWGLGLVYSSSLGGIGEVKIDPVNKTVYVAKQNRGAARGAFEMHYYFKGCYYSLLDPFVRPAFYHKKTDTFECVQADSYQDNGYYPKALVAYGTGPFVSVNTSPFDSATLQSDSKIFDSFAVGWMVGLNALDDPRNPKASHSLNIGLGAILDTGVRALAPGVVPGQVTTLTDVNSLTVNTTKVGFMAIISYKIVDVNFNK